MKKTNTGFSLIELVVVMLIIAILTSIAVPTYMSSVRKSRRTEARAALVDLQAREERYYSTHPSQGYSSLASDLGYAASGATTDLSTTSVPVGSSGYYVLTMTTPVAASTTTAPAYTVTATAIGDQLKDTSCRSFTVDQTGLQAATDSSGASAVSVIANCWK